MLRNSKTVLALAALAVGLFLTVGRAEDRKPDDKKPDDKKQEEKEIGKSSKESEAAMNFAAALRMADYGRANKAPEALLAAARVIGKTNVLKAPAAKDAKKGDHEEFDALKEANSLIEEAIKISDKDDAVKTLAKAVRDDVKEFKSRSAVGGPRCINGTVSRGDRRDTFSVRFRGGERAVVRVNNRSNRGDVDLYVVDDNGRVVARDRRPDDDAGVSWYVRNTQTYQIIVHCYCSGGDRPLRYTMTTN